MWIVRCVIVRNIVFCNISFVNRLRCHPGNLPSFVEGQHAHTRTHTLLLAHTELQRESFRTGHLFVAVGTTWSPGRCKKRTGACAGIGQVLRSGSPCKTLHKHDHTSPNSQSHILENLR